MGDALFVDGLVTSAQEARVASAGLLALQGPGVLDVRTGVLVAPGSTSLVSGTTTTAPSWTYQIAPHNWVTSRGSANGPYLGALEAATTVSTALPPASNSRIDVIWVKQGDAASGVPSPDGTTAPVYGVTSGTAAPSPAKPAIPVGAVELATATVPSSATGGTAGSGVVITQTALQTVARGGLLPVASRVEMDALTPHVGLYAYRTDLGLVFAGSGSGWVAVSPKTWTGERDYGTGSPVAAGSAVTDTTTTANIPTLPAGILLRVDGSFFFTADTTTVVAVKSSFVVAGATVLFNDERTQRYPTASSSSFQIQQRVSYLLRVTSSTTPVTITAKLENGAGGGGAKFVSAKALVQTTA